MKVWSAVLGSLLASVGSVWRRIVGVSRIKIGFLVVVRVWSAVVIWFRICGSVCVVSVTVLEGGAGCCRAGAGVRESDVGVDGVNKPVRPSMKANRRCC